MAIKKENKNRTNLTLIRLEKVSKSDLRFLYNLLHQRDPQANISHKKCFLLTKANKIFLLKQKFRKCVIF